MQRHVQHGEFRAVGDVEIYNNNSNTVALEGKHLEIASLEMMYEVPRPPCINEGAHRVKVRVPQKGDMLLTKQAGKVIIIGLGGTVPEGAALLQQHEVITDGRN
jgi:hypothetical protein